MIKTGKSLFKNLCKLAPLSLTHQRVLTSQPIIKRHFWLSYSVEHYFSTQKHETSTASNIATAQQLEHKASMLMQENKHDQALEQFTEALKIRENLTKEENHNLLQIYSPRFNSKIIKNLESLLGYGQAKLNVLSNLKNEHEIEYLNSLISVGLLLTELNRETEAKPLLSQAAEVLLKDKSKSSDQATNLTRVSSGLQRIGENELCWETSSMACKIFRENEKLENYEIAGVAHLIHGISLFKMEHRDAAKKVFELALKYLKKTDSKPERLYITLLNLGQINIQLNLIDEAERNYNEALAILKNQKQNIENKRSRAKALYELGNLQGGKKNYSQALENNKESYSIYEEINEQESEEALKVIRILAILFFQNRQLDESIEMYEKTIPKLLASGKKDPDLPMVYFEYGMALKAAKKLDQAITALKEGISVIKNLEEPSKDMLIQMTLELAKIYYSQKNLEMAAKYLDSTLQYFEGHYGPNHQLTLNLRREIEIFKTRVQGS